MLLVFVPTFALLLLLIRLFPRSTDPNEMLLLLCCCWDKEFTDEKKSAIVRT